MSKAKHPLLSLGATGTVGNAMTYTRRRGTNIVQEKPIPAYRYTLPQAYQRWHYKDGIFYWQTLSAATKQAWKSLGARHHMTGFAYFMRDYLNNLPDLVGLWHLDYIRGATTPDSSKQGNTGTVFGAVTDTGIIDGCFSFDGINDYVNCGKATSLNFVSELTFEAWFRADVVTGAIYKRIAHKGNDTTPAKGWQIRVTGDKLQAYIAVGGVWKGVDVAIVKDVWYWATLTYDGETIRLYLGGLEVDSNAAPSGDITDHSAYDLMIGQISEGGYHFDGLIDHVPLYNRCLTGPQILEHSKRRWP